MNKKKNLLAGLLAAVLSFTVAAPAFAAKSVSELKQEMAETEEQRKKAAEEINQKQAEKDEVVQQRNELDQQISGVLEDIEAVEETIQEKDDEIELKNDEIGALQDKIDQNEDKLKTRMRIMYEYGNVSYLELILESKGLSDLFTRIGAIRDIVAHDQELINTYVSAQKEIEEARAVIEKEKEEQEEVKGILNDKEDELKELQEEKDQMIDSINSDIAELERLEKQAQEDYDDLQAELNAELAKSAKGSSVTYSGNGKFLWPAAAGGRVSSNFNPNRVHPILGYVRPHNGTDIAVPMGSNVLAGEAGKVVTAGWNNSYGYYVTINHGGGYVTLYAHNSKLLVKAGDTVTRGQVIAKAGSTGNSTGPHIHFEVRINGTPVDAMNYV